VDWKGKAVLVLGLGDTGLSCVRFLAARGADVRAADTREAPPALGAARAAAPGIAVHLGPFSETLLAGVDAVIASPGLALREPLLRAAVARGLEVSGDVEVFGRELRARAAAGGKTRVIGVTGTNGKSTVTALAGAMARAAGLRAEAVGNIGRPVLDALLDAEQGLGLPDLYVVELSSYQLETTANLDLEAGAMLNVTQDHLDRYLGLADYARAKARIFRHCGTRVVNRDDRWSLGMSGGARTCTFGQSSPVGESEWGIDDGVLMEGREPILPLTGMGMQGLHNAANALAAHALLRAVGAPREPLARAIAEFRGLPHRLELVAEAAGVRFYDDSKGTNVGAAVAALAGFTTPVVLIAGGDGKGQDFAPLAPAVRGHARAVVLIGRDAPAVRAALAATGVPLHDAGSMYEAVETAATLARPGDAVLLSPACASFDMFRNYGHRGQAFAEAARTLAGRAGH